MGIRRKNQKASLVAGENERKWSAGRRKDGERDLPIQRPRRTE